MVSCVETLPDLTSVRRRSKTDMPYESTPERGTAALSALTVPITALFLVLGLSGWTGCGRTPLHPPARPDAGPAADGRADAGPDRGPDLPVETVRADAGADLPIETGRAD